MMSLWDALRMNMMISYQELVRTFPKCNSRSGIKNVLWNKQKNKWAVQVRTDFGRLYFGLYEDLELACLVASEAINKYHGQYAKVV